MNFGSSFATPTKIKKENNDVIDLDLSTSSEDLAFEWNAKVRLKLNNHFIVESEQNLDSIMKQYIRSLKDEVINFEDCETLKRFTKKHLDAFKLSFTELNCCFTDNYLDNMEEILAFYVSLELKSLPMREKDAKKSTIKRKLYSISSRINSMLNIYLLYYDHRKFHVLMKVKLTSHTDESRQVLNTLYGKLLTGKPKSMSDLEFCRAYILYQKWKTFRKSEEWEMMDQVMYKLYDRTPESVKSNPVLNQILFPQSNSVLDTLVHISEKHLIISEEYFKFIKCKTIQGDILITSAISDIEIQDPDFQFIISDEEDPSIRPKYKEFLKELEGTKNGRPPDVDASIKIESSSEDEECQLNPPNFPEDKIDPSVELCHEIRDDDMEMLYATKRFVPPVPRKDKSKKQSTGFLDSIELPDSGDVSTETVSSSTSNVPCLPASDPPNNVTEISSTDARPEPAESPTSNTTTTEPAPIEIEPSPPEPVEVETPPEPPDKRQDIQTQTEETMDLAQTKQIMDLAQTKQIMDLAQTEQIMDPESYGIITPPSDQHPDEQITPTARTSNVYANIVRSCTPDELDSFADTNGKVTVSPSSVHRIKTKLPENVTAQNPTDEQEKHPESEISSLDGKMELRQVSPSNCLPETSTCADFEERAEPADVTSTSYDFALPSDLSTYVSQCAFESEDEETFQYAEEEYEENTTNNTELYPDEALSVGANVNVSTEEPERDAEERNAFPLRELKVSVEKIDVSSCEGRISALGESHAAPWSDTHGLDEAFCGPVSKIDGAGCYPNPDSGFDLFSNGSRPSNSSSELTSPAYETIDDFRTYYEERKNDATQDKTSPDGELGVVDLTPTGRSKKRVHIVETIMDSRRSTPQPPTETVPRGILKKSPTRILRQTIQRRIPARLMNVRSLEQYNVEPDDWRIQATPVTVLERLPDSTISQWLHVTEISRKVRRERQSSHNVAETIRVDYDKQSTSSAQLGKRDTVWYSTLDGTVKMSVPDSTFGQWRPNSVTKTSRLEEGLQQLPYTDKKPVKRKRQSDVTVHANKIPKRGSGFRKAPVANVEEVNGRKTRKRKKLEWD